MPLDMSNLSQYIDYVVIGVIALGLLGGFIKGMFKSVYNLIVFVGLVLVGWIMMPKMVDFLLDYNISQYNFNFQGVAITTLREAAPAIIATYDETLGSMMVEGTESYALVFSLVYSVLRLAIMIVWLILVGTIFKFIFWIFYQIIKPRRRDKDGNKKHASFTSRLGGGIVGVVHAAIFVLMLAIPFAGICSVGNDIAKAVEDNKTEVAYRVNNNDDIIFVELDNSTAQSIINDNKELFDFMANYRNSLLGTVGGLLKTEGKSLDEYIFDKLFSFETEEEEIALRTEIGSAAKAYVTLFEATGGVISSETIAALDEETLDKIFGEVENIKLINVVVPIGVEYVFNNEQLKDKLSNVIGDLDKDEVLAKVKQIDFSTELSSIGGAYVNLTKSGLLDAISNNGQGNILQYLLTAKPEEIEAAFSKLGDLSIIDLIGEVGVKYLLSSSTLDSLCEKYGIDKSSINLDAINWKAEVGSLGGLITALQKSGISIGEDGNIDISKVTEDGLNGLVDSLYKLNILNKNTSLLTGVVKSILPKEYQNMVPEGEVSANDMKSLLTVGTTVIAYQTPDGNIDFMALLKSGDRDKLAAALSDSEFLSKAFEGLIAPLLKTFGMDITIEDLDLNNIDWGNELIAFTGIIDELDKIGLKLGSSTTQIDFKTITDTQIDNIVDAAFKSQLISNNSNILMQAIKKMLPADYQKLIDVKKISAEDMKSTLKLGIKLATTTTEGGIDVDKLLEEGGVEELAETIANSEYLSENMDTLIGTIVGETGLLPEGQKIEMLEEVDWSSEEGKKELEIILEATKIVSDKQNLEDLLTISEEEKGKLLSSKVITSMIVSTITSQAESESSILGQLELGGIANDEWVSDDGNKGELEKLIDAAAVLNNVGGSTINIDTISNLSSDDISTITDSKVVTNTLDEKVGEIIEEAIIDKLGDTLELDINIGEVEATGDQTKGEAWAKELETLQKVATTSQTIKDADIKSEESATAIGSMLDSAKDSQVLGSAAQFIAQTILDDAYSKIEGQEAPKVDENSDLSALILQANQLLNK